MPIVDRGMPPKKEAVWKHMYNKEDLMKLKWFQKNQQNLIAECEREALKKGLSPEILAEVERMRKERYQQMERFAKKKGIDAPFQDIDPHCIQNVMKPIDPEVRDYLYKTRGKDGRPKYLKARYKIKPDERYYFPECSSWVYGWKIMENYKRNLNEPNFGRRQIIKHSFYRRNNALGTEPSHQKPPQEQSPMVCGCI